MTKPKTESGAPLADAAARKAVAEDLRTTMLVEAAAGTGKTTSLVQRMVALVAIGAARVESLSAVTFTIRAAAQLSQRFQNALEARRAEETDPGRRRNLDDALRALDACFVGTIHAFCARLLRERPVEAGVDPGFREMDEPEDNVARAEAWQRFVQQLFVADHPAIPRLASLGVRLSDLEEAYDEICENSDVEPVFGAEIPEPDFTEARRRIQAFLAQAETALPPQAGPDGWTGFEHAVRRARRLAGLLDTSLGPAFVQVLQCLRGSKAREKAPRALKAALEALQDEIIQPALRQWAEFLHPVVMPMLVGARDAYREWRRANGRLNFQDLLLEARNLLRKRPDVRRALRARFTPILVDEFQDTDPIQAEILFFLTGEDVEERDWQKLRPAPGSLFVVGDPKQSIYRFRRADIRTYQIVRDLIVASGGKVVELSTNFRSTGELCDWVNRTFGQAGFFPAETTPQQARYVALQANRPPAGTGSCALRLEVPGSGNRQEPVVRDDSERIARTIASQVAAGARKPGDFLVLFRRRRHMGAYARALEQNGIPFEIAGGGAFGESKELGVVLPLLQSLADPDDPVAFVAALRGPVFGVDDDALYRLTRAGGRFRFTAEPPAGSDPRIVRAAGLLREALAEIETFPPAAAISRLCGRLGLTALAAAEPLGESRAGNLLKALAAARKFSSEGLDFRGVVRELAHMRDEDLIEQMSTEPGRPGVVRLMTLHGAKGLEAPVVFLAEPAVDSFPSRNFWIDRSVEPPAGYFRVAQKLARGEQDLAIPRGWEQMCEAEEAFERAEDVRLLYVGATRAEELLVVSIKRTAAGKAAGPWADLDRWLGGNLPLPGPVESKDVPPTPPLDAPLDAARAERERRLASVSQPAYAVVTVTNVAHAAGEKPAWESTGRGLSWGRVLHGALEAVMLDPGIDLRIHAANLLAAEERPPSEVGEVVRVVEAVRASALWARALAARRRLVEVPFALPVERAEIGLDGSAPTVLQGVVDLVFEEEDGWILVDYKSDTVTPQNRGALEAFYAPQITHYRKYWERLTGRPTRAGLLFVATGELVMLADGSTPPSRPS